VVLTLFVRWELRVTEPMLDMRFFRNPAFSIGVGGMILVFLATLGTYFLAIQYFQLILGYSAFSAALRFVPAAGIMVVVSTQTPRLTRRFGAARVVSTGMLLVASGLITWRAVGVHTPFLVALAPLLVLVAGSALCMSPMTTSIMSAVPARRAGVGSAMNDATRELGTALGIAVLGSLAVSQFSSTLAPTIAKLPAGVRDLAGSSLGGALAVASKLPAGTGRAFASSADRAFVDGLHFSVTLGAALVGIAAVLVRRYLPSRLPAEGPLHGALESVENLELGLGGAPGSSDEIEPAELPVRSG
jgi:Na+/melibiose symporter-like transporter